MQMARLTVTKEESGWLSTFFWSSLFDVLKNFELICYCDHFTLRFWSGSKGHKIVVKMDPENRDKVHVETTRETWNKYLKTVVQKGWDLFRGVIVAFAGEMVRFMGRSLAQLVWNQVPALKG